MSIKETPYFDGKVKPAYVGPYKRKLDRGVVVFSQWDGRRWLYSASTPDRAAKETMVSAYQRLPWCGLSKDPNAGSDA